MGPDGTWRAVLVVRPSAQQPHPAILDHLGHEYGLRDDLDAAWALRPLELVSDGGRPMLVLEDSGGEPLHRLIGEPMEMGSFLRLALHIATALDKVHQRGLVHRDIKPHNIIVDRANGEIKLTGFGIASQLARERQAPEPPETIAGTLAYMAPEQTGRMNRSIDSRSDLYALGVTFYEMLTGSLPFAAVDPMGWIHCHIAREAMPPRERARNVPAPVSAIVMKLLSKAPEDRYQTAAGLAWDLQTCLAGWEAAASIDAFLLGTHDRTHKLVIQEKLYGRDVEINTLVGAFERVVAQGKPELVLVSGYSGIGKSSVVNELHKFIVLPRGIFISGKYDFRLRDIPYSTLAQAFQGLIRQILNGEKADADRWRDVIGEAIGKQAGLLTEIIPELATLIGPQPPAPQISSFEAQLRFQSVFQNFVRVFARAEHPLVIFIDDLQWLDPATLTVLETLITHRETSHLLLIGAYRDNEVGPDHPLKGTLGAMRKSGAAVHEIVLGPLSVDDFTQLLCDSLKCEREEALALSALVHEKSGGNPLFAGEFLMNLAAEGLLEFEPNAGSWRWDPRRIAAKGFTDNVVDLMVRKLQRLSRPAREALTQLACLGSQADFDTLVKIRGRAEAEIQADFADAVRAGAILSQKRSFKFTHDRVQEAAYALIPPESRAEQHLRVGRLLLSSMSPQEISDRIFDVLNQLNLGSKLISESDEQLRLAMLNLEAAKKAKASTAYSSACRYLAEAVAALGQQGWRDHYDLTFSVWFERAECEFLNSNFVEAARWIDQLLLRAESKVDRAQAYQLRMVMQLVQGNNTQAVRTGLECLQMLGIELAEHPTNEQVQAEYDAVWSDLGARPIGSLLDLPVIEDKEISAVLNVLSLMHRSAYLIDHDLWATIVCRMVNVTQQHGTTDGAVISYILLGTMLGPIFHRYAEGEEFARLALAVAEKHDFVAQKTVVNFGMQLIVLWTRPIEVALVCLDNAISHAKETGEIVYTCYSMEHRLTDLIARGDHLDAVWGESGKVLEFVDRINFRQVGDIVSSTRLFIQSLRVGGPTAAEEASLEARLLEAGIPVVICFHWILQLQRHFLFSNPEAALAYAEKAKPLLWCTRLHIQFAHHCLFHSLALAAVYGTASEEIQAEIRAELAANVQALERWARSCPETFGHKHLLVCGELARLDGRDMEAVRLYERAAQTAGEHGFIQDQALANELAGQCCLASGAERAARAYLREARECYFRWGAHAKVAQLDQRYPAGKSSSSALSRTTIEELSERLDVATIIKTAQAISGEMVLEDLIRSLMVIAVEHAGADRGLLILPRGDELWIEAEATIQDATVVVHLPRQEPAALPISIVDRVVSARENVLLDDASAENPFSADPYFEGRARSVLCLPLLKQAKFVGALYLENNLAPHVFTSGRIALLNVLASQAAISLENTQLYRQLEEREARIRRLVDANIIGIIIWDFDGRIIEANDTFLRMLGFDRDDFVSGRVRWTDLIPPEWRDRSAQTLQEVKTTGTARPFERDYFRKDGSRVPVLIGAASLETNGNQGVAFVLDLTERKRAESEARASERRYRETQMELAHANRVATMGQLTASIAHEVNQPIAATKVNAQAALRWLNRDAPDLEEARQLLARIVNDGDRAGNVVSRIRHLVKKAPPRMEPLHMNEAISEVIELTRGEAIKNGVTVQTQFAESLPAVTGDRTQLQQVILNLILNAVQAMSQRDLSLRELWISTSASGSDGVLVSIRDSGPGILPESLDRLFDPFYTTKSGGMGMGLSICRSIIEGHGGQIWATSNGQQGAAFNFTLPTVSQ
jgi:PAS domain S-box-containing protein